MKTLHSQKILILLKHLKLLQSKNININNYIRYTLRKFYLKVGIVGTVKFETLIKELFEKLLKLIILIKTLLVVQLILLKQFIILHHLLINIIQDKKI